ncbi:MAG: SCP2 sterol-binding domain-containing protein [Dehalococcoidia bacterium]|jgi:putative sterol carrier protein
MALYGTQEWADLVMEKANADKAYEEAGKNWEGAFYLIIEKGGSITEPIYTYLDLWHGKCRKAVMTKNEDDFKPEFTMSATMETWEKMMTGKADGMQLMATRKLKIKGSMAYIGRNVKATGAFTNVLASVPTEFPK